MKCGSLVLTNFMIYLDSVKIQENEQGELCQTNIVNHIDDIPFRPGEIGLILSCRKTAITNKTDWVTILTPSGIGMCFSDEIREIK